MPIHACHLFNEYLPSRNPNTPEETCKVMDEAVVMFNATVDRTKGSFKFSDGTWCVFDSEDGSMIFSHPLPGENN